MCIVHNEVKLIAVNEVKFRGKGYSAIVSQISSLDKELLNELWLTFISAMKDAASELAKWLYVTQS